MACSQVLFDHGQINITHNISPNAYLADAGYIKLGNDGEIAEWQAYVKGAGASAYVYLKKLNVKETYECVYRQLLKMAEEGIYGFERVYIKDEV